MKDKSDYTVTFDKFKNNEVAFTNHGIVFIGGDLYNFLEGISQKRYPGIYTPVANDVCFDILETGEDNFSEVISYKQLIFQIVRIYGVDSKILNGYKFLGVYQHG